MTAARQPRPTPPPDAALRVEAIAVAAEVPRIRHAVVATAAAHGMTPERRSDIALAVSEACTNVVAHAYADAATPGPLTVEVHHANEEFVVVVSDEGRGVVPRAASSGLGLGLGLIARLTERMEIGSNGLGGAKVTMAFSG